MSCVFDDFCFINLVNSTVVSIAYLKTWLTEHCVQRDSILLTVLLLWCVERPKV